MLLGAFLTYVVVGLCLVTLYGTYTWIASVLLSLYSVLYEPVVRLCSLVRGCFTHKNQSHRPATGNQVGGGAKVTPADGPSFQNGTEKVTPAHLEAAGSTAGKGLGAGDEQLQHVEPGEVQGHVQSPRGGAALWGKTRGTVMAAAAVRRWGGVAKVAAAATAERRVSRAIERGCTLHKRGKGQWVRLSHSTARHHMHSCIVCCALPCRGLRHGS